MPREAIASKIETAVQITATYSQLISTFCQYNVTLHNILGIFTVYLITSTPSRSCQYQASIATAADLTVQIDV